MLIELTTDLLEERYIVARINPKYVESIVQTEKRQYKGILYYKYVITMKSGNKYEIFKSTKDKNDKKINPRDRLHDTLK